MEISIVGNKIVMDMDVDDALALQEQLAKVIGGA